MCLNACDRLRAILPLTLLLSFAEYIKKKKGDDFPVTFIFEDQAENNFNTIFTANNGNIFSPFEC